MVPKMFEPLKFDCMSQFKGLVGKIICIVNSVFDIFYAIWPSEKWLTTANSFLLNVATHDNFSVNIVGIFVFIYRENFVLS